METEKKLQIAIKALRYYAKYKDSYSVKHGPGDINEFGCGCCSGAYDQDGEKTYDSDVVGSTAHNALVEIGEI